MHLDSMFATVLVQAQTSKNESIPLILQFYFSECDMLYLPITASVPGPKINGGKNLIF
jgi:hypothetical protein